MERLYKLYLLDRSGHIVRPAWIEANSDGDAIAQARDLCTAHDGELWLEKRKVGNIPRVDCLNPYSPKQQEEPRAD